LVQFVAIVLLCLQFKKKKDGWEKIASRDFRWHREDKFVTELHCSWIWCTPIFNIVILPVYTGRCRFTHTWRTFQWRLWWPVDEIMQTLGIHLGRLSRYYLFWIVVNNFVRGYILFMDSFYTTYNLVNDLFKKQVYVILPVYTGRCRFTHTWRTFQWRLWWPVDEIMQTLIWNIYLQDIK
jgi:hypothetical protein